MNTKTANFIIDEYNDELNGFSALRRTSEELARKMYEVELKELGDYSEKNKKYFASAYTHRHMDYRDISFEKRDDLYWVTVSFEQYCSGDLDTYEYTFPISWFDDVLWEAKYYNQLTTRREERLKAEEENLKKIKSASKEKQEKKEREDYERLKAKFEPKPI